MKKWCLILLTVCGCSAKTESTPAFSPSDWADAWVDGWSGSARGLNIYAHESQGLDLYTFWAGDTGSNNQFSNRSDCSFFVNVTIKRSYGWSNSGLASWLCQGNCPVGRPQAFHYHDTILRNDHFAQITNINSVQRGDLIAIKYLDASANTGHLLWVQNPPVALCASCSPTTFAVSISDSSSSYHGDQDSRYIGTPCLNDSDCSANTYASCSEVTKKCSYTGIGRGTLRLLADPAGTVLGYSWSTSASSTYYLNTDSPVSRHIVIGRYDGSAGL